MELRGMAGVLGSVPTLPVRVGSEPPDENGLLNGVELAKRSVEHAAVSPPITPMKANREAARINSPPSLLRITRPNAKLNDRINGLLGLSFR